MLWERSGHWANYADNMFTTGSENRDYAVKPMNCPCHVQIFNQGLKSYRDLPLRMAEFGACHRNEPSGALHGLMRVRGFVQDDGHIFCTEQQIEGEVSSSPLVLLSGLVQMICGTVPRPDWPRRWTMLASSMTYSRVRGLFMAPKSSLPCTIALAEPGNAALFNSISTCRSV